MYIPKIIEENWFIASLILSILFTTPIILYFILWIRKKIFKGKGPAVKKNTLSLRGKLILGLILLFVSMLLVRCSVLVPAKGTTATNSGDAVQTEQSKSQDVSKNDTSENATGYLDAFLNTMLSFSGEASTDFIAEGVERIASEGRSESWTRLFIVHTYVLSIFAPIAGGALLFEILANIFPSLVAWFISWVSRREKYYFSELNEKSLALARSINDKTVDAKNKPVMIAMANDTEDDGDENSLIRSAQKIGMLCVKGDLLHFRISHGKKKLILINEDEGANVQMLATLCEELDLQQLKDSEFYVFTSEPAYDYAIGKIRAKIKQRIECAATNSAECNTSNAVCVEAVNATDSQSDKKVAKAGNGKLGVKRVKHKNEVYPDAAEGTDNPETASTPAPSKKPEPTLPIVLNVNGYNNLIKNLLDTVPLFEPIAEDYKKRKRLENTELNLTIIGLGKIGMEMLIASYWCGQILDTSLNITAISRESEAEFLRKIDYVNPEIMDSTKEGDGILEIFSEPEKVKGEPTAAPPYAKIEYLSRDIKSDEFLEYLRGDKNIEKPNYYFISAGSDIENIEMANRLCELLSNRYCMKKHPPKTVITYVVYDSELARVLNSRAENAHQAGSPDSYIYMRAVGSLEEVYSYENVFMERFIKSADNVHSNYNEARGVDSNALRMLFANDYGFYSTIARVIHIKYKVFSARMWEASIFEAKSDEEYLALCEKSIQSYKSAIQSIPRTDKLACDLAWLEHRRWVAFIRTQGFRGYDNPDAFFKHFNSQKSIPLKRHLCLIEARRGYTYSDDKSFIPDKLDEIYRKSGNERHFKHTDYPYNDFKDEKKDDCCVLNKKRCRIPAFLRSLFHKKG